MADGPEMAVEEPGGREEGRVEGPEACGVEGQQPQSSQLQLIGGATLEGRKAALDALPTAVYSWESLQKEIAPVILPELA